MSYLIDDDLQDRTAAAIAELRKVAVMIDELRRDALEAGRAETEIPLGDAIQAVHRAVIVLHSYGATHQMTFAVEWE